MHIPEDFPLDDKVSHILIVRLFHFTERTPLPLTLSRLPTNVQVMDSSTVPSSPAESVGPAQAGCPGLVSPGRRPRGRTGPHDGLIRLLFVSGKSPGTRNVFSIQRNKYCLYFDVREYYRKGVAGLPVWRPSQRGIRIALSKRLDLLANLVSALREVGDPEALRGKLPVALEGAEPVAVPIVREEATVSPALSIQEPRL